MDFHRSEQANSFGSANSPRNTVKNIARRTSGRRPTPFHEDRASSGREETALYVGSFSKILSPTLRLGYLVLPRALIERYQHAKWFTDLHTPSIDQLALGLLIQEGHLEKHIAKGKKVYKKRRESLYPVEAHAIVKNRHAHKIILGYGNVTPEEINEGVARMKGVLR